MIKAIIIEDEPLAQEVIKTYIDSLPNIELIGQCFNAIEANEFLRNHTPDLMFVDIEMPQLSGIEFIKSLNNPPKVIFTTAYTQYAVDGFELNAVDYLVKPIAFDRFLKAINKVEESLSSENRHVDSDEEFMFVKADKKLVKINYSEILYIEGLKDYVIIKLESGRVITLQTLKSLEDKLPKHSFMRIHRSFICNIQRIKAVLGNIVEIMEDNKIKQLPIGKSHKDELLEIINENRL